MSPSRAVVLIPLMILILLTLPADVEGAVCFVPSGFPDVSTALANGCTSILFDGNVNEPGPVNIIGLNNILIDGNGYTWVLNAPNYITIRGSTGVSIRDVDIVRNGPLHTIYVFMSRDVNLYNLNIQASSAWWRSAVAVNQSDDVLIMNTVVIDNGVSSRSKIYILDSNASILDTYVSGTFWGIEINNSDAFLGFMRVYIDNATSLAAHYGMIIRDYDPNPLQLVIRNSNFTGNIIEGIYGYFRSLNPPTGFSEVHIVDTYVSNSGFNNIFLEAYDLAQVYLNITNVTLSDADVWRNFVVIGSHNTIFKLDVDGLTVSEDGIHPFENIQLYTDSAAQLTATLSGLSLVDALDSNMRLVLYGASSQKVVILNSVFGGSSRYNFASYQDNFSFLDLNVSDSNLSNAPDTNLVLFNTASNTVLNARFSRLSIDTGILNNVYIGASGPAVQNIYMEDSNLSNSINQNIKVDYNGNTGGSKVVLKRVNASLAPYGIVYWSLNSPGSRVEVHESIINRFWMWDIPGSSSTLFLNETLYDELSSLNDNGVVQSRWTLKVVVISSITGYSISSLPIDFYDMPFYLTTSVTDSTGVSLTTFNYLYDESNPFIDQLYLLISSHGYSLSYGYLVDGGLTTTLPSIFGEIQLQLGIVALKVIGYYNQLPMVMEIMGSSGKIYVYNDLPFLATTASVKTISFVVTGVHIIGDYVVMSIAVPSQGGWGRQVLIYDRVDGLLISHGVANLLGWRA